MSHAGAGAARSGPFGLGMALILTFCLPFVSVRVYLDDLSHNVRERKKTPTKYITLKVIILKPPQMLKKKNVHLYNLHLKYGPQMFIVYKPGCQWESEKLSQISSDSKCTIRVLACC